MDGRKKYYLNENYFDVIDTEEKAYFLGFIFADGNISDGKDRHYRLRIGLKYADKEILDNFKDLLAYSGEIHVREMKYKDPALCTHYLIAELSISNKHLIARLRELGCVPNKSLTVKYPIIPKRLDRHFIRGYFDGNGSIYHVNTLTRMSDVKIELCSGSNHIFKSIIQKLVTVIGITTGGVAESSKFIRITKSGKQAMTILDYLYDNSAIHLSRKYALYQDYARLAQQLQESKELKRAKSVKAKSKRIC